MKKIASIISTVGHPLLMIPIIFEILLLKHGKGPVVYELSIIIGSLFLIATLWVYVKFRNGSYSNFDVSVQKQRKSLYLFVLPLLTLTAGLLFITGQPEFIYLSFAVGIFLMSISFGVNFIIKTSLHVSLNSYLSAAVLLIDPTIGIILTLFTIIIAWSRIVLKRHTYAEVLSGFLIGITSGFLLYLFTKDIEILNQY